MSNESDANPYDFNAIDAAVKETERGRWFLAEYDRRSRSADTQTMLGAIAKLEKIIKTEVPNYPPNLAEALRNTKAEIDALQENLPVEGTALLKACNGYASLNVHAAAVAAELSQVAEILRSSAEALNGDAEGSASAFVHLAERIESICISHNVLADRIAKTVKLLVCLDQATTGDNSSSCASAASRLEKIAASAMPKIEPVLSGENLKYFCKDEELFVATAPGQPTARLETPPAASKPNEAPADSNSKARIVIVRTPSSVANPIPLAEDTSGSTPQTAA
ncbi:MAG TPA: hypothetical protein VH933_07545 [Aestuariivirgaceae bacterium]|jgi:hypothetical protein